MSPSNNDAPSGASRRMSGSRHFTVEEALALAERACVASGANPAAAHALAAATVSAETWGRASVGFAHLPDYLVGLRNGSIEGCVDPDVSFPRAGLVSVDAKGGVGQLGFDRALPELKARAGELGVAILMQRNSFTVGELGYYVRRLAQDGFVAIAATNSRASVTPPGAKLPLFGTNPIAFGAPAGKGKVLLVDQSSSETALVNVRRAAAAGERLPPGWALDASGLPTTDPAAALAGSLTPFGGARGANVALIVEVLAAGVTGAGWSLDAPDADDVERGWNVGLFVLAIRPEGQEGLFTESLGRQLARLCDLGAHVPGLGRSGAQERGDRRCVSLPIDLVHRIEAFCLPSG